MEKTDDQKIFLGAKKMRSTGIFSKVITIPAAFFKLTKVDTNIHFDIYLNPKNSSLIIEPHKTVNGDDSVEEEVNKEEKLHEVVQ